jgi:flagellar biosynthesis protein FlhF
MIVKSFISDTVAGALKMARNELGGDAVILKTRRVDGAYPSSKSGKVEVTACVDRPTSSAMPSVAVKEPIAEAPAKPTEPNRLRGIELSAKPIDEDRFPAAEIVRKLDFLIDVFQAPLRKNAFPGNIGRLFTCLLHADFPEAIAYDVTEKLADRFQPGDSFRDIAAVAIDLICRQLPESTQSRPFEAGQKLAFVGPAGSGKTSLLGRLAGYVLRECRMPVVLTSFDQVKVAAHEELATYADILDVDHFAMPRQTDRALIDRQGKDKIVLLDTPALNPRDRAEITAFAEKLTAINPDRIIGVFPATVRSSDLFDTLRAYRSLKMTDLAVTMTDQTCRLGGIIAMSMYSGLPLSILGTGRGATAIKLNPNCRQIIRGCLGAGEGDLDE